MHQLLVSLGSNLGNRFENLQLAINYLFEEVGAVLKISSVYETPAVGFDGGDFLNCAVLLETELNPEDVLKIVLNIETKMGRTRHPEGGYVSRPIDIDLLFFDDDIIKKTNLQIPHPEIQNRKFVLLPVNDIAGDWEHPVLKKKIPKLLAETSDLSDAVKMNKWLVNPMKDFNFSRHNYIVIEGNLGVGKTSLTSKIAHDFDAKLVLERFKDNPFLPKFYENPARYAFPVEMSFLADRFRQLSDEVGQLDIFKNWVISDYEISKSLIFAGATLEEDEFLLYRQIFQMMIKDFPKPDLYIYLYQDVDRLLENIKKRGRDYEQNIQKEYLQKINKKYLNFIQSKPFANMKIIDVSDLDFIENRKDYLFLLEEILRKTPIED